MLSNLSGVGEQPDHSLERRFRQIANVHRFTNVDDAYRKDSYPTPRVDGLMDSTAGHERLSFLDAYSGYQHIRSPNDEEKTALITDRGLIVITRMPFSLKNSRATFQKVVDRAFEKQIGRNV